MAKRNGYQMFLTVCFLAIVFGVGIAQTAIEVAGGRRPQFVDLFVRPPTAENFRSFETDLKAASWFARELRPWIQYARFVGLKDAGEKALVGRDGWMFYRPDVRYLIEPYRVPASEASTGEDVVSAVLSFRDQLGKKGIRLLVVPAPGKPSVYPEMLTARAAGRWDAISAHTRNVIRRLTQAGVDVVNLFDVYAQARTAQSDSGTSYYLARDTHWSPTGVRLAAEAVARRVRDLGVAPKPSVEYDVRPVPVKRVGDVLRMMQSPPVERLVPCEDLAVPQVVRKDGGAMYKDDPQSPILVLGDSFLRIYERDEPGSAGFIALLARELGLPVTSIVSDGGASTLVRQELARKPALLAGKKLVIWEFVERDIRFGMEGWKQVSLHD